MALMRWALACALLWVGATGAWAAGTAPPIPFAQSFVLDGSVEHKLFVTAAALKTLPPTKLNVYFNTGAGPAEASFTGVLLWDLLSKAVVVTNPTVKNDILRDSVAVVGSDGYVTVFSLGELAPQFGGDQVIVAYEQDGVPLGGTTGGFARIVAPQDKAGGRAVESIVAITVFGCR